MHYSSEILTYQKVTYSIHKIEKGYEVIPPFKVKKDTRNATIMPRHINVSACTCYTWA